jgi:hypothetical protein
MKSSFKYPLGVTMDFWEETTYYRLGCQTWNSRKVFLPNTFIRGRARKSNNLTMLVGFSRLPHGFNLLEGNVRAMDSPPTHELKMPSAQVGPFIQGSSRDLPPSWRMMVRNVVGAVNISQTLYSSGLAHSTITKPTCTYRFKPWTT